MKTKRDKQNLNWEIKNKPVFLIEKYHSVGF